jgi:hypothetical protein
MPVYTSINSALPFTNLCTPVWHAIFIYYSKRMSGFDMAPPSSAILPNAAAAAAASAAASGTCTLLDILKCHILLTTLNGLYSCYCNCLLGETILELREFLVFLVFGVCLFVLCLIFCSKKAMLGYLSPCADNGHEQTSVAFMYKKETMHRFDGSLSS